MTVVLLDHERDLLWSYDYNPERDNILRDAISHVALTKLTENTVYSYRNVQLCKVDDLIVIASGEDNIENVVMRIKDIAGKSTLKKDNLWKLRQALNNDTFITQGQEKLICTEIVTDKLVGHIKGHCDSKITLNTKDYDKIEVRDDDLYQILDNDKVEICTKNLYWSQVRYEKSDYSLPVVMSARLIGKDLSIRCEPNVGMKTSDLEVTINIFKTSSGNSITKTPNNLMHSVKFSSDHEIQWTILELKYALELRLHEYDFSENESLISGTLSCSIELDQSSSAIQETITRHYQQTPWKCEINGA